MDLCKSVESSDFEGAKQLIVIELKGPVLVSGSSSCASSTELVMPNLLSRVIVRLPFRADGCAGYSFSERSQPSNAARIASLSLSLGSFAKLLFHPFGTHLRLVPIEMAVGTPLAMRLCAPAGS